MVNKTGCQCFTCRHGDEPRVLAGYLQGYIDASNWFLNWANRHDIKQGSIADDDLPGIIAQMDCNKIESECILSELPDLENENIEREMLLWQRRQRKQKMKILMSKKSYRKK